MAAAAKTTDKFVGSSGAVGLPSARASLGNPTTASGPSSGNTTNSHPDNHTGHHEEIVVGMDVVEDHHHHHQSQQKVPVWVGPNCKLVSGISKSTTCHDLISSILPSSQDPSKFVLVEKWKKMERILDPSVKILKVWKAWGDQIGDVSFVLRSSPTADGYIDKKSSRKVHRKRSSSYHQQKISCLEDECDKEGHRDAMEQLIKLVITQGEAIQAQLKKLRQQEFQIERYEEKMHKMRSTQLGENYVVDTYLKDEVAKGARRTKRREKSPCKRDAHVNYHHQPHHHHHHRQTRKQQVDLQQATTQQQQPQTEQAVCEITSSKKPVSGLTVLPVEKDQGDQEDDDGDVDECTELTEESKETIKEKTELMENIFQLNVKLTQEEERLVKLGLKIRKLSDKQRKAEWEELALEDISQELEHLKQVTNEQSKEIEINERNLSALEQLLDDKHDHVAFLTHEIQLIDEQSEILQRKVLELASLAAASHPARQYHAMEQNQQVYPSHMNYPTHHPQHVPPPSSSSSSLPVTSAEQVVPIPHEYQDDTEGHIIIVQGELKEGVNPGSIRVEPDSYRIHHQPQNPSGAATTATRYQCQQQQVAQQPSHETCSSSCSNSSSSVCVQLIQKPGTTTSNEAQDKDNDSNSDTGISSLHSSVDENPMYVLDTLV